MPKFARLEAHFLLLSVEVGMLAIKFLKTETVAIDRIVWIFEYS